MTDETWKGGYDKASWMGRYAEQMMRFAGMESDDAWSMATGAWEVSDEDCDPDEIAEADIAYMAEDAR